MPLERVRDTIALMVERNHVVAEGAGAIPVAAALYGDHPYRRVCAVVSGGNLDAATLRDILERGGHAR